MRDGEVGRQTSPDRISVTVTRHASNPHRTLPITQWSVDVWHAYGSMKQHCLDKALGRERNSSLEFLLELRNGDTVWRTVSLCNSWDKCVYVWGLKDNLSLLKKSCSLHFYHAANIMSAVDVEKYYDTLDALGGNVEWKNRQTSPSATAGDDSPGVL